MKKSTKLRLQKEQEILAEIKLTEIAFHTALSNLESMTDPDLIDCYIYELNAAQVRYKYLINQARDYGISCPYAPREEILLS